MPFAEWRTASFQEGCASNFLQMNIALESKISRQPPYDPSGPEKEESPPYFDAFLKRKMHVLAMCGRNHRALSAIIRMVSGPDGFACDSFSILSLRAPAKEDCKIETFV